MYHCWPIVSTIPMFPNVASVPKRFDETTFCHPHSHYSDNDDDDDSEDPSHSHGCLCRRRYCCCCSTTWEGERGSRGRGRLRLVSVDVLGSDILMWIMRHSVALYCMCDSYNGNNIIKIPFLCQSNRTIISHSFALCVWVCVDQSF